jgi:nitroreductase
MIPTSAPVGPKLLDLGPLAAEGFRQIIPMRRFSASATGKWRRSVSAGYAGPARILTVERTHCAYRIPKPPAAGVAAQLQRNPIMPDTERLMTLFEAIAMRRAVRAYRPDPIGEATVRELLKEAVRAPTAMHAEPWAFAIVQDRALLNKYSELAKTTWSVERDGARAVGHPPAAVEERAVSILLRPDFNVFYDAGTLIAICARPLGSFVAADCWLAAENLMLAACAMGLGSCCIGFAIPVLNRADVKAELGIPPEVVVVAPIIVGVPSEQPPATTRKPPEIVCWRKEGGGSAGISAGYQGRSKDVP